MKKIRVVFVFVFMVPFFAIGDQNDDLFTAAKNGETAKIKELLLKKANFNALDKKGKTALQHAVENKKLDSAKLLIAAKLLEIEKAGGDYIGYSHLILNLLNDEEPEVKAFLEKTKTPFRSNRDREDLDLFGLLSGGLAIRESIQTDTIRPSSEQADDVAVSTLKAPEIKSHPFEEMVAKRSYRIPELSRLTPESFYFFHSYSLKKTLEAVDYALEKGMSVYKRYQTESVDFFVKEKIMNQLALKEHKEARIFYDSVIEEVAITGSDIFVRNGSDVTLIFKIKNKMLFDTVIGNYRKEFESKPGARRQTINLEGMPVDYISTPGRVVNSYYLQLEDDKIIISNSPGALKKIIQVYRKKTACLADASDFKYMQSLFYHKPVNQMTVYLSDAFVRHLVSPELRIKESRRMQEIFLLSLAERLCLFYKHLTGTNPPSMKEIINFLLAKKPNEINEILKIFQSVNIVLGSYSAESQKYGKIGFLTPNIDIDLVKVSKQEAIDYDGFVKRYSSYWSDFFDPIGIRIDYKDKQLSMETHILPLVNLSIYNAFKEIFGGTPVSFTHSEIPGDVIGINFKLNAELKKQLTHFFPNSVYLQKQLGNFAEIGLMDASPMIDFDSNFLMREMFLLSRRSVNEEMLIIPALVWSLFHPIRLSLPIAENSDPKKIEKAVDEILVSLPGKYGRSFFDQMEWDYYIMNYKGKKIRVLKWKLFGTLTFRFYCLIEHKIHIASTEEYIKKITDTIIDGEKTVSKPEGASASLFFKPSSLILERNLFTANIMENLKKVNYRNMATFELMKSIFPESENHGQLIKENYGFMPFCPLGGKYSFLESGRYSSSLFGNPANPMVEIESIDKYLEKTIFMIEKAQVSLIFTDTGIVTRIEIKDAQ